MLKSFPSKYYLLGCCSVWDMSKTSETRSYFWLNVFTSFDIYIQTSQFIPELVNTFCMLKLRLFLKNSKTTAPRQAIFKGKLSTIISFKLCKFYVNLWTLCFAPTKSSPRKENTSHKIKQTLVVVKFKTYCSKSIWLSSNVIYSHEIKIKVCGYQQRAKCILVLCVI